MPAKRGVRCLRLNAGCAAQTLRGEVGRLERLLSEARAQRETEHAEAHAEAERLKRQVREPTCPGGLGFRV